MNQSKEISFNGNFRSEEEENVESRNEFEDCEAGERDEGVVEGFHESVS